MVRYASKENVIKLLEDSKVRGYPLDQVAQFLLDSCVLRRGRIDLKSAFVSGLGDSETDLQRLLDQLMAKDIIAPWDGRPGCYSPAASRLYSAVTSELSRLEDNLWLLEELYAKDLQIAFLAFGIRQLSDRIIPESAQPTRRRLTSVK